MAIKTFASGEVLTAADTNTYLNNGGLVYITSSTMSGLSNSINNCFTSTYTNYRIVINVDSSTASSVVAMRFRVSGADNNTSNYYFSATQVQSGATTSVTPTGNPDTSFTMAFTRTGVFPTVVNLELSYPQQSFKKMGTYQASGDNATHSAWATQSGGFIFDATTSFDGLSIFTSSGVLNGTITVYGYRKA